jgi:hypothetical protein
MLCRRSTRIGRRNFVLKFSCHGASSLGCSLSSAPMRLVRFSSSSLELGRSDPHSDVFVDDASFRLVQTDFSSFPDLGLDRFSRPENFSSTISHSSRNGRIVVLLEGRIVKLLRGFLSACKLGSSTPLLHCWKYLQC